MDTGDSQPRPVGSGYYRPPCLLVLVRQSKSLSYVQIPPPAKVESHVTAHRNILPLSKSWGAMIFNSCQLSQKIMYP